MDFIVEFSKQTGDFFSLSGTDLRVMALAYKYILRNGEESKCRKSPPEVKQVFIKAKPKEEPKKVIKKQKPTIGEWNEVEGDVSDEENDEEYEALLEKEHEEADLVEEDALSDSDDAGEWVTPDNVDKHLLGYNPKDSQSKRVESELSVRVVTSDFSM